MKSIKYARVCIVIFCAALFVQIPAEAQEPTTLSPIVKTTAIEVALMYHKLLDAEPDYAGYVQSNTEIQENTNPALRRVIVRRQEKMLQDLYAAMNAETLLYAQPRVLITAMEINQSYVGLSQRGLKAPIRYELDNGEVYGVIIRNARDAMLLNAPYVQSNINGLYNDYVSGLRNLPVEMLLKPVVADPQEHIDDQGKPYKVLAVDLVELRIRSTQAQKLVLVKRFLGWSPDAPSALQQAIQESGSKPTPIEKAPTGAAAANSKSQGTGIR